MRAVEKGWNGMGKMVSDWNEGRVEWNGDRI